MQLVFATLFPSLTRFLAAAFILMGTQAVYVLIGFGAGLLAVGSLSLFLPTVTDVVVVLLLVSLPSELLVVCSSRNVIAWREVARIGVGVAFGAVGGTLALKWIDPGAVLLSLAAVLLVSGTLFLVAPERAQLRWPSWSAPLFGLLAGGLTGLLGTGGPPLVLYYRLAGVPKERFRGNLMTLFMGMTLVRLPSYAVAGLLTGERLWSAALLLPAALLGAWIGRRSQLRLSEARFRWLVSLGLMLIGASLLLSGIR